jgi:geranylgeranyl diphosphate synthase type II
LTEYFAKREELEMSEKDLRIENHAELVRAAFETRYPALPGNTDLVKSMRYSLLASGKRIRPHLTFEFCKLFGGKEEQALAYACAVEAVHTYSLIHDDLPCMDNDDLRRGRPTNHRVYGEAIAMLAGDALLTEAFALLAGNTALSPEQNVRAVALLARKSGYMGMVGGQDEDIRNEDRPVCAEDLDRINGKKTGDLLLAACELGCIAAGADEEQTEAARVYARNFGAAFQIVDDILDVSVSTRELGKNALSDVKNRKTTYVTLLGKDGAYEKASSLTEKAVAAISGYKGSEYLVEFAKSALDRRK